MSEQFAWFTMAKREHAEKNTISCARLLTLIIFVALLVGTAIDDRRFVPGYGTVESGSCHPAIAVTKATLVVLFFMHIKYSSKLMKLTVGAGLFTFLILVGMSLSDYFTRAWGQW